ncbi:MAG: lipopolysaccharide biosynthesis protein [Clostridia bacterium]|nr:lipopolysaccharide biosynthesis protein [Clostridia bacterium]
MNDTKNKVLSGLIWKFGERISAQVVTFVVSVILARLLPTEAYGLITLVTIFITFANCVVTNGFGSSLIQKKDATNTDFSTVLYFQFIAATAIYILLFVTAPLIATFFGEGYEQLAPVLRVLGLRIPLTAINNVQQSYVSKKMIFRKFFFSTIIGTIISAVVGIRMAYAGYGVWALVAQYLTSTTVSTIVLAITIKWKPELKFSLKSLKELFRYGWKILIASIIGEIYNELRTLIIGKLYTSNDLAFFDKGKQIPNIIVTNINTTISNVLFPAISNAQNNITDVRNMMRRSIKTTAYIMCPLMFGLAVVAEPVISLLLTDKWLPCVPYLQIYCITYCFEPIQTSNLQAIKALGRSDIILKLEIIKKGSSILILFAVMNFGVDAIAYSLFLTTLIASIANTLPNKKLIAYSYRALFVDMSAGIVISAIMAVIVYAVGMLLNLSTLAELIIQIATGGIVYFAISAIFKVEAFTYLKDTMIEMISGVLKKQKKE